MRLKIIMISFCLDRRDDKQLSLQVLKDMKKGEYVFIKQVEELQEQLYLCLVTINLNHLSYRLVSTTLNL